MPYEDDYKMWLEKMLIESNPDWVCDGMYDMGFTHEWCEKYCGEDSEYVTPKCLHMYYHHIIKADRKTENSSENPNNCEHITEDGVTCAKYPACDDCLDNPLNKLKGSERLVKGSEQTEPTISKMEQVDEPKTQMKTQNSNLTFKKDEVEDEPQTEKGGCTNCDGKDLCNNAFTEISQYCGAYEPQNGYQTFNGTSVYVSRLEDEPQSDCPWK